MKNWQKKDHHSPDSNFLFSKECSVLNEGMLEARRGAEKVKRRCEESERTFLQFYFIRKEKILKRQPNFQSKKFK
jgi:hypothetical protein